MRLTATILLGGGCATLAVVRITQPLPIILLAMGLLAALPLICTDVARRGFGPRYIWAGFGAIIVPAAAHALVHPTADNWAGLAICLTLPWLYLAGRAHPRALMFFPYYAIIESVAILCVLTVSPHPSAGVFTDLAHFSCLIILVGMFTTPPRLKWALWVLGPAAILVTGSEEGLLLLGVAAAVVIWRRTDWDRYRLAALASIIITLAIIVPSGHFAETHPKLTGARLDSIGAATNHRSSGVSDSAGAGWVLGSGWKWDTTGGRDQTLHNIFLKMMAQYGVVAMAGLFLLMSSGLLKTPLFYPFLLLFTAGMVDHYLVTYLLPWPFLALGVGFSGQPARKSAQNAAPCLPSDDVKCRRLHKTKNGRRFA